MHVNASVCIEIIQCLTVKCFNQGLLFSILWPFFRVSGSPRVLGDEDEEDVDDLENEFSYIDIHNRHRQSHSYDDDQHVPQPPAQRVPQIPLLTDGRDNACFLIYMIILIPLALLFLSRFM